MDALSQQISQTLLAAPQTNLRPQSDDAIFRYLADSIYLEQRRFDRSDEEAPEAYQRILKHTNRAIRKERSVMTKPSSSLSIIMREIHNLLSTYAITSKVLPGMLTRLSPPHSPRNSPAPTSTRQPDVVQGPTVAETPQRKSHDHRPICLTVLQLSATVLWLGLKPVVYGAGLNLFPILWDFLCADWGLYR